jgi:mannitol/fructose-specific phosphotransferase system IIA component (Ntr-type)
MRIRDILKPISVRLPLAATTKDAVLEELTSLALAEPALAGRGPAILEALRAREVLLSTGIGRGVAIPHAELAATVPAGAAFGVSAAGIDFGAPDGKPVSIFFLTVVSRTAAHERIELLGNLSRILRKEAVREEILRATRPEEIIELFDREERLLAPRGP